MNKVFIIGVFFSFANQSLAMTSLDDLEKKITQQISATANEQQFVTKPIRTKIQELLQTTTKTGELRYEIFRLEDPLKTDLFKENNLSTARKFAIKGLELLGLRNKYTNDEKNKALTIITELEKTKKRLQNSSYSDDNLEKAISNRYYDMRKFDKAIHEQRIITGDALLPYFGNVDQPSLKLK
jgi:hypothetical protein